MKDTLVEAGKNVSQQINTSLPGQISNTASLKQDFLPALIDRFWELVKAPIANPDILWTVIPLVITLFIMEFYFGRYRKEKVGWNTAVGNALILIYITFSLFRFLFNQDNPVSIYEFFASSLKPWVALFILFEGLFLMFINYFHVLPKALTFSISSALPINLTAYVGIVFVYSNIPIELLSILAAVLLFVALWSIFGVIKHMEWKVDEETGEVK